MLTGVDTAVDSAVSAASEDVIHIEFGEVDLESLKKEDVEMLFLIS